MFITMSSINPIFAFPEPVLTPIYNAITLPNHSNLAILQQELNRNTISVPIPINPLDYLVLTVLDVKYLTHTQIPFLESMTKPHSPPWIQWHRDQKSQPPTHHLHQEIHQLLGYRQCFYKANSYDSTPRLPQGPE